MSPDRETGSGHLVPPYNASGSSLCLVLGHLGFDK